MGQKRGKEFTMLWSRKKKVSGGAVSISRGARGALERKGIADIKCG